MLTLEYLNTLPPDRRNIEIVKEYQKCRKDPIYTIETYFTVLDAAKGKRQPFLLYPHQKRAVTAFVEYPYNLSMKSRQMGFTTLTMAFIAWVMCTKSNQVINALAQEKKTSRKFLRGVRQTLDNGRKLAPWLVPGYSENNNGRDSFTVLTGCIVMAEANKPDACRGDTINWLFCDEISAITHMDDIWASAGITLTKSNGHCIGISTPKGQSGWYYEQYTRAEENGWNIVEAHWSEHPDYSLGMYQYIKDPAHPDGGYIKHYNEGWPDVSNPIAIKKYKTKETYPFVIDGRLRSPWYDYESKKLGVQKTRCELDCSFAGSGSEVFEPETIRALKQKAKLVPVIPNIQLGLQDKGPFKSYKQYREFNPDHGYCISADVATGDGSDFSTAVIIDLTTKEVVGTYKDMVETTLFAKVLAEIGRRFGNCVIIVEYQGPGISVLMELKNNIRYSNLYQHDLKRNEITKPQRKKIGFWQGQSTRALGGDKTEEVINTGEFLIYSLDFFTELETWIWDKDGKRRHAPGKNDDLIMAFSNAMFYIYHALERKKHNREMMKKHFGKQIIGSFNSPNMFDDEFRYGTGLS